VAAMDRRKRLPLGIVRGPGDRRVGWGERRRHRSFFRIIFIPLDRLFREWGTVRIL